MIRLLRLSAVATTAAALSLACSSVDNDINVGPDGVTSGGVSIATIEPAAGPQGGGQVVTITGTGFSQGDTTAVFGDAVASETLVMSATQLVAVTSAASVNGAVDVVVFTNGGYASRTGAYTTAAAPTVTAVSPAIGGSNGGGTVTVTGSGFDVSTPEVLFGGVPATVSVTDANTLEATLGVSGAYYDVVGVEVRTDGGSAALPDSFIYAKPGMLGVSGSRIASRNELIHIATDGVVTFSHELDVPISSLTRGADGTIYAAGRDMVLYTVELFSGKLTRIGAFGPPPTEFSANRVHSMVISGGVMYGTFRANNEIVSISQTTGVMTPIGTFPGIRRLGRTASATFNVGFNRITEVNPLTATEIGAPIQFDAFPGDLRSLHTIGGETYAIARLSQTTASLFRLNTVTAQYTEIFTTVLPYLNMGVTLDL